MQPCVSITFSLVITTLALVATSFTSIMLKLVFVCVFSSSCADTAITSLLTVVLHPGPLCNDVSNDVAATKQIDKVLAHSV
jgi:hypothetical protein